MAASSFNPFTAGGGTGSKGGSFNPFSDGQPDGGGGEGGSVGADLRGLLGKITGSKPVGAALSAIDIPRAAVVSAAQEGVNAAQGKGVSLKNFVHDVKTHEGAGQIVQQLIPNANPWVKRLAGFAGDVGADPLTYLTGGASAAEGGAIREGTHLSVDQVAKLAAEHGMPEAGAAAKAARTASVLSDAEKADLGIKTGLRFGTNLTGHVEVPFGDNLSKLRAAITNPVIDKAAGSKLGTVVQKATESLGKAFVDLKNSDPIAAMQARSAERFTRHEGEGFTRGALKDLVGIGKDFKTVDRPTVSRLIEDPVARAASTAPESMAAAKLGDWFEKVRVAGEQASGRAIPKVTDDYLPHQMTEDFKKYLDEEGRVARQGRTGGPEPIARKRAYTPDTKVITEQGQIAERRIGEKWLGQKLETGTLQEMEQIAKDTFGDKYRQVFKNDPFELAQGYAKSVGRMVADARFQTELEARGLMHRFDKAGLDAALGTEGAANRSADRALNEAPIHDLKASRLFEQSGNLAAKEALKEPTAAARAAGRQASSADTLIEKLGMKASDLHEALNAAPITAPTAAGPGPAELKQILEGHIAKLQAQDAALEPQRAALEAQQGAITHDAAQASRAVDEGRASLGRLLDATSVSFNRGKAAEALRSMGDERLNGIADQLAQRGSATNSQRLIAEARQHINSLDEQAASDALARHGHANAFTAEAKPGQTVADVNATAAAARRIERKQAAIADKIEAHAQQIEKLNESFDHAAVATDGKQFEAHTARLQAALDKTNAELAAAHGRKAEALADQQFHLESATKLASAARAQPDKGLAEVARLESLAEAELGKRDGLRQFASDKADFGRSMNTPERVAAWEKMQQEGFTAMVGKDPSKWATPEMAKVLDEIKARASTQEIGKYLKGYDAMLNRWKAYALLTPGFSIRNYLSHSWNNWMAGVDKGIELRTVRTMHTIASKGFDEALRRDPEVANAIREGERLAAWGGRDIPDMADISSQKSRGLIARLGEKTGIDASAFDKFDPTSMNNVALNANQKFAEFTSDRLRAPLFVDRILKGFSPEMALDDVIKYHFDYSELSKGEQSIARRVVPFYTWSRKNFPLQIENMISNPGKFNRFNDFKRNVELGTPKDAVVPAYFDRLFGIRTPFTSNGNRVYTTPDLPLTRLNETLNTQSVLGGLTPLVKLPLEEWANKSVFTGKPLTYPGAKPQPVPLAFEPLAPLLHQLDGIAGLPKVTKDANGHYVMDPKQAYKIDQAVPALSKLRRLAPNEPQYKQRWITSLLSILGGVKSSTLTPTEIQAEVRRRATASK